VKMDKPSQLSPSLLCRNKWSLRCLFWAKITLISHTQWTEEIPVCAFFLPLNQYLVTTTCNKKHPFPLLCLDQVICSSGLPRTFPVWALNVLSKLGGPVMLWLHHDLLAGWDWPYSQLQATAQQAPVKQQAFYWFVE
jgi:hypothetical protein